MYKIIASDMDETFLNHQHKLVEANISTLKTLKDKGIFFVPSSGRPYWSIMQSLQPIEALLEGSYILSFNGGSINKVGQDQPLVSHTLPFEQVNAIFNLGKRLGVGMHVYELQGPIWGCDFTQDEIDYLAGHIPYNYFEDNIEFLRNKPIAKILFVKADITYLENLKADLEAELDFCDLTISANRYLEMNPKGVNKGAGLKELASILDIDIAHTIAVGDSLNDLEMIEDAGVGVAVANAHPLIKDCADFIAESSCDDGVLAEIYSKIVSH